LEQGVEMTDDYGMLVFEGDGESVYSQGEYLAHIVNERIRSFSNQTNKADA
jgi:hypothetical protein